MKRGLYVRAGDCATARLAACAISLFGPTTNDSKVFRGLSPSALPIDFVSRTESDLLSFSALGPSMSDSIDGSEGERKLTSRGAPKAVTMAACSADMWLLSIQN